MHNVHFLDALQPLPGKAIATLALTNSVIGTAQDAVSANGLTPWTACASEGGDCSFYANTIPCAGADGADVSRSADGPEKSINDAFGDPLFGVRERCAFLVIRPVRDINGSDTSPETIGSGVARQPVAAALR